MPTCRTSLTAAPVVLSCSRSVPVRLTPGIATVIVPVRSAAIPAPASSMRPVPPVSETTGWLPVVSANATFVAPTRTTGAVPVPPAIARVVRSKAKSPLRVCPRKDAETPTASTRRNGPAGSPSAAAPVLLTAIDSLPLSAKPGTLLTWMSALMRPATPAALRSRLPSRLARLRNVVVPSPRLSETFDAATRVLVVPPTVERSNVKSPDSVCPATLSVVPVPVSLMYGPAGMLAIDRWLPIANGPATAAGVVLSRTSNVPPSSTPGRLSAIVPPKPPASPAVVTSSSPAPFVSWTIGVPPSPIEKAALATPIRRPSALRVKEKSPETLWPRTASWRPRTAANGWPAAVFFSASANLTTTSPSLPGIVSVWSTAKPKLLTRTRISPDSVRPGKPRTWIVPRASKA